jgi:hypothetical protein
VEIIWKTAALEWCNLEPRHPNLTTIRRAEVFKVHKARGSFGELESAAGKVSCTREPSGAVPSL